MAGVILTFTFGEFSGFMLTGLDNLPRDSNVKVLLERHASSSL